MFCDDLVHVASAMLGHVTICDLVHVAVCSMLQSTCCYKSHVANT